MVKKIAAPRKAAAKTPARKATKAKAVTAPKTHKPKGAPKERLAYLNKGEMKALEKRKGSPARRGPKGLPSFAEDSASSKGVSRGDTSGTKGSGSTKTANGSVSNASPGSRGAGSNYGSGSGRPGTSSGGQGNYNSGTSGSRFGGASTQRPGMGRNEGRVGPVSPMGGQGASFANPRAAAAYNRGPGIGIDDRRGLQNMPQQPYGDNYSGWTNPNMPSPDVGKVWRSMREGMDAYDRAAAAATNPFDSVQKTPQEIANDARAIREARNAKYAKQDAAAIKNEWKGQSSMDSRAITDATMRSASRRTPDIRVGSSRASGVAGGRTSLGDYRKGGLAKRTFKNK